MAPRKRTNSGSKKSSHQNQQQQQQQPSQPSKFGIQHFFERHTQNSLSQNPKKPLNPPPISNPTNEANFEKNELNNSKEVAQNPRNETVMVKSNPQIAESLGNATDSRVLDGGLSGEMVRDGGNLGVSETNSRGNGSSNLSQNTPTENQLPVVIDVGENRLDEVSPEVCKSVSVKRFKFSPGMLIKQSQDDGGDEVSWRISPVNERLHAMSKRLPGTIKVLADSSRFNSLNFQQCSNKKTSPGAAGKLGKWLSSPPLKAAENSSGHLNKFSLRKVCPDHDVNHRESNGETKSRAHCEVPSCQSPFTTPPSLSYCHEKPASGDDADGASDHLGSRHHKKALIELLDQVENVISVEESVCTNLDACSSDNRNIRPYPAVEELAVNAEEKIQKENSNYNFLVLEVSEKQGFVGSSGSQSSFKIIRLLNEQSGEERSVQLVDEWFYSVVAPGDTVHVIGEFDGQGKCEINRHKNFLIVHPDILVSGTRVAGSFSCPRRAVLDERLKSNEHSTAALVGTLLHQIFQAGLVKDSLSKEVMEEYARVVLQKNLESLYACGANENDIHKTLIGAIPRILNWISLFRDSQGSRTQGIDFGCNEGLKSIKISEVVDIEEMGWAPKYGLKGMIDASLRIKTESSNNGTIEKIMPLEFKTGKGTSGQTAMEHSAQVMLYTLLMSERYQKIIDCGLLYYLQTDQTQGISVQRSDLIGLIMRRNELANDLLKALTIQQLPPMLQSTNMCRGCRHLNVCSIYHKAHGGTIEGSGLGDVFDSLVHHLTNAHASFLRKWDRLIDLEASELEILKKQIWCSRSLKNDRHPAFLSSLKIDASDKLSKKDFCKGNKFVYRFVRRDTAGQNRISLSSSSSLINNLDCTLRSGDYVILSTEPDRLLVANGVIMDISSSHVAVSFTKRLRLPGSSPVSTVQDLQQQAWRIDKDEVMASFAIMRFNLIQLFLQNEQSSHLRKMIVDIEVPRFDSGCVFSQDPAISYIWSEKSLNDDQRRAILKILTARDYALILGMPGTGKTSTMVHAVKALLIRGASVLLTSYTNTAVDNLLIKLKAQGIDFIRIGRYEAVHEEVRGNCLSAMDVHSIEEIKQRMDQTKVVAVTCLGITSPLLTNKRFDVCIMDEAGQTTLPVSLGPLMFASKFVLVGDHYQLPPLVQSTEAKENGMAVSLFCRLSEAHPHAISALRSQYRMCAGIMELSNALIYGNRLRCGSSEIANAKLQYKCVASAPSWLREVLNPDRPVIFINTDMLPAYETNDRKAINNPTEASIIAEVANSLVHRGIVEENIGIITPYNSQANLIRQAVSKSVEIHTIDKYQGRDKDCILVSFVRSSENLKNCISSLLGDWHRINVAITRAKKKLIMVGSCRTLSRVPLLKLLIEKVEEQSFILSISKKDFDQKMELKRCSQIR